MSASIKRKIIMIGMGMVGLVIVFFVGRGLSKAMYSGTDGSKESIELVKEIPIQEDVTPIQEEDLPLPKEAMTEDEIQELFVSIKEDTESSDLQAEKEIDFDTLMDLNPHVYAWISIPGTNIEYPILQHPMDNGYYLNHNIDGSYGYPACIYTENMNSMDFKDPNTVIYGHNMRKKETMFNQLHKFAGKDFFEENRIIQIILPDQVLNYKIFAAYTYDDRHLMLSFDFKNPDVFESYLKGIMDIRDMGANIDRTMEITPEDKIITLVTCMMDADDELHRYLVQAVLEE